MAVPTQENHNGNSQEPKWDVASSAASTQMILILFPGCQSLSANQNAYTHSSPEPGINAHRKGGSLSITCHRHILTIKGVPFTTKNDIISVTPKHIENKMKLQQNTLFLKAPPLWWKLPRHTHAQISTALFQGTAQNRNPHPKICHFELLSQKVWNILFFQDLGHYFR